MGSPFTATVAADVAAACQTAFPTARVEIDRPLLEATTDVLPYINVGLDRVEKMSGTPTFTTYLYRFVITARFAFPGSGNRIDTKLAAANTLNNALITSPVLSPVTYGTLQDVSEATFTELDGQDRAYEVQVYYSIAINGPR